MQKQYPWAQVILVVLLMTSIPIYGSSHVSAATLEDSEESPGIALGAHIPPVDPSFAPNQLYFWQEIATFNQLVGQQHPIIMYYGDLTSGFNDYMLNQLRDRLNPSPVPYIQMDPYGLSLNDIANGVHDAKLRSNAAVAKRFGKPMIVGFAHEFNITSSPFFGDPAAYIAAWRRVHDVFAQEGVTNVQWLWPPNYSSDRPDLPTTDYNLFYPGDQYVDWIGVFGFNWGSDPVRGPGWVEFEYLFDDFLRNTSCRYDKPILVGATGSVDGPGSKAQWIAHTYSALQKYPNVRAILWFNDFAYGSPSEADFRVTVLSRYGATPGPIPTITNTYKYAIDDPPFATTLAPYNQLKPPSRVCFTVDTEPKATLLEWGDETTVQVLVDQAPIFGASVSIGVAGAPDGMRYSADPPIIGSDASDGTIELQATRDTPPGSYILTVSGEAEGLTQSTTLRVTVVEEAQRTFLTMILRAATP